MIRNRNEIEAEILKQTEKTVRKKAEEIKKSALELKEKKNSRNHRNNNRKKIKSYLSKILFLSSYLNIENKMT